MLGKWDLYFVAKRIQMSDPWPSCLKLAFKREETSPNWSNLTAAVYKSGHVFSLYLMLRFTRF